MLTEHWAGSLGRWESPGVPVTSFPASAWDLRSWKKGLDLKAWAQGHLSNMTATTANRIGHTRVQGGGEMGSEIWIWEESSTEGSEQRFQQGHNSVHCSLVPRGGSPEALGRFHSLLTLQSPNWPLLCNLPRRAPGSSNRLNPEPCGPIALGCGGT